MARGPDVAAPRPSDEETSAKASARAEMKRLGKYIIRRKIGAGGMGTVYLAQDSQLKRTVALKVLPRDRADNQTLVRRFQSEAQAAAILAHENIVTIYEAGQADGYLYIALEYVDGIDVHKLVAKRGILPVRRSLEIVKQVARALDHAHRSGIVHRDIKPSNLLIRRDGVVKLTDFGLARSIDETSETGITRAGTTVGTVDYMSPEQARDSKAADVRSDIYSLGCTWYHMLTGSAPFAEGSLTNKLNAHAFSPPPDPREKNPAVPEAVVAVLHRMMAKSPADRYATPAELLRDLENANLSEEGVSQNILAALVDAEATVQQHQQREAEARARREPPSLPPKPAPQRAGRKQPSEADEKKPFPILWVAVGGGVLVGILLLWLVVSLVLSRTGKVEAEPGANPFAEAAASGNDTVVVVTGDDRDADPSSDTATETPTAGTDTPDSASKAAHVQPVGDGSKPDDSAGNDLPPDRSTGPIGRAGEGSFYPEWVAEAVGDKPTGGHHAGGIPQAAHLVELTVQPGPATRSRQPTLERALEALPREGGIVRINDDGPFILNPIYIANRSKVVIRAAPGKRPVLLLAPTADSNSRAAIRVSRGALHLEGVDLVLPARWLPADAEFGMVHIDGGDLFARDVSFVLMGERRGPTVAMFLVETLERTSRILLERVAVRGNGLTGVVFDQARTDAVIANTLLSTGTAPAVVVTNRQKSSAGVGRERTAAQRVIRFVSTTFVGGTAVVLEPGVAPERPPSTRLEAVNCVLASSGQREPRICVHLRNWPEDPDRPADQPRYVNLAWPVTRSSLFLGWTDLIANGDVGTSHQAKLDDWERHWRRRAVASEANSQWWSPARQPMAAADGTFLARFDASTLPAHAVQATDGGQPGCLLGELPAPEPSMVQRIEAVLRRPRRLQLVWQASTTPRMEVDLNRADLGRVLSQRDWPSGTTVVARGSGLRTMTPVTVRNKRLRIRFVQTDGPPLTLEPKRSVLVRSNSTGKQVPALFTVEHGSLELIGARFRIPRAAQYASVRLLNVVDGSFALRQCLVRAAGAGQDEPAELIRWVPGNRDAAPSGSPHQAILINGLFATDGALMQAEADSGRLIVHGCGLLAGEDAFRLSTIARGGASGLHVDIDRCTVAFGSAAFDLSKVGEPAGRIELFVSESLFAPMDAGAGRRDRPAAILKLGKATQVKRIVDWWGDSNGFATGSAPYALAGGGTASPAGGEFLSAWTSLWGPAHVLRPIAIPGTTVFTGESLAAKNVQPVDLALRPGAPATTWSRTGDAIGANPARLGPAGRVEDSDSDAKSKKTGKESKPRRPDF